MKSIEYIGHKFRKKVQFEDINMGVVSILMALKPEDRMKSFYMHITVMNIKVD